MEEESKPETDETPPPPKPAVPRPMQMTGRKPAPAKGHGKGKGPVPSSHRPVPSTAHHTVRPKAKARSSATSYSSHTSSTRSGSLSETTRRSRPLWVAPQTGQCFHRNEHCVGLRNANEVMPMWRCATCMLRDTLTGLERVAPTSLYAAPEHDIYYHNSQHCNRMADANRIVRFRACNLCAEGRHLSSDTGGPPSPASAA